MTDKRGVGFQCLPGRRNADDKINYSHARARRLSAEVLYDLHEGVPVIPRSAVITEDERNHVFVIGEDGSASRRSVELGYERAGMIEVRDGVEAGETVVTAGKGSLSDGARVEVITVGEQPKA